MVKQTPGAHWVETDLGDGTTGRTAWAPYGAGFEIPLYFEYEASEPFDWRLSALVVDGRARCIRFECQGDVSPENLHRFPLGRYLEEATLMASRPEDEIPGEGRGADVEVVAGDSLGAHLDAVETRQVENSRLGNSRDPKGLHRHLRHA